MNEKEKSLLNTVLLDLLPYDTKVSIDFKEYLKWLPDEEPYRESLEFVLRHQGKSIEDLSKEPHILYSYPCEGRFGMLRGYENEEYGVPVEFIRPFLRPVSSMIDKEVDKLFDILKIDKDGNDEDWIKINDALGIKFIFSTGKWAEDVIEAYDYLNSIHINYRLLDNLVLEAPEGMYVPQLININININNL